MPEALERPTPNLEQPDTAEPEGAKPARVVIVDDSVSVCKAVERMLAPRGAEVVAIHTGEEALARIEGERPDLVICDLILPDLEGLAVCRFVRESPALGAVPLLAISGLATDDVRRQALEAGAEAVLKKPFRGEVLLAEVDGLLAGGRSAAAPEEPTAAPEPVLRAVAELEALPGLVAGSWWLASGAEGRLRTAATETAPDPEAMLARLRSFAAPFGVGDPAMLLVEGDAGELLLVGHRERCGIVCLHLTQAAVLGKARYLARKFLRRIDPPAGPAPRPVAAGEPARTIHPSPTTDPTPVGQRS